ncbi:MAG: GntR family transcriptional regulator [Rhodospirillales bacterium]
MQQLKTKPDLTKQALEAIREAILSGELPPCAPVAQEEMAERLGVSRQPVSRALVLLQREGLIVERGRKGYMVAPIDAERLLALYQVRGALDRLAARLAAVKDDPQGTRRRLFDRLMADGRAAVAEGSITGLVAADVAFHQALYALAGNPEIAATAEGAWPHMVRAMRMVLEDTSRHETIWADHGAIAEAIMAGDVDGAGELAARHVESAGGATYRRLKNLDPGLQTPDATNKTSIGG